MVAQGELWLMESPTAKARPVLVVSRTGVIPVVNSVVVAPVTTTVRRIPTCLPVGREEGLDRDGVASFDNLAVVPKALLTVRLGSLRAGDLGRICSALRAMADC